MGPWFGVTADGTGSLQKRDKKGFTTTTFVDHQAANLREFECVEWLGIVCGTCNLQKQSFYKYQKKVYCDFHY